MKRRIPKPGFIFLGTLALLLQGCSAGILKTPEPAVEFTFTFPSFDQEFYDPLLKIYQKQHPNHTVVAQPFEDEYNTEGDVQVVWIFQPPSGEAVYRNLDEMLASDESLNPKDWYPGLLEAYRYGGQTYAVPYGLDPYVLYYNQDLIERLGIHAPRPGWNWNDFLDLAQALTLPDEEIYGYASILGGQEVFMFIYMLGGRLFDEEARPTLNEPATIKALDWYTRLYTQYEVGFPIAKGRQRYHALESGKVGMWISPFSIHERVGENLGLSYRTGITQLPASGQQTGIALFEGYAISSKMKNPNAAWSLIRFLLDRPNPRLVPARRSIAESRVYRDMVGDETARIAQESVSRVLEISSSQFAVFAKIAPLVETAAEQVISGKMTAEEALEEAQRQAQGEP